MNIESNESKQKRIKVALLNEHRPSEWEKRTCFILQPRLKFFTK